MPAVTDEIEEIGDGMQVIWAPLDATYILMIFILMILDIALQQAKSSYFVNWLFKLYHDLRIG